MTLELVQPKSVSTAVPAGQASVLRGGSVSIHIDDLRAVGLDEGSRVSLLVDRANALIGMRAARDGEYSVAVQHVTKTYKGRRTIGIRMALKELGIERTSATGRYDLIVKPKEHLLVVGPIAGVPRKALRKES